MPRLVIPTVVCAALASGAVALASGRSNASPQTNPRAQTTRLYGQVTQLKIIDPGGPGFGLGEERVAAVKLLRSKNGSTVGLGGILCTVVSVADPAHATGTMQCTATYTLAGGEIASQGLVPLTNGLVAGTRAQAITGGTGRFRTTRGEITYAFLMGGVATNIMISIAR